MATIRAAVIAGAVFALLNAAVPAQAQNRQAAAAAPLQLVPGPDQATRPGTSRRPTRATKSATKRPAKKAVKAADAPGSRTKRVAERAKKNARSAATTRRQARTPIRAVQSQPAQRAISAALPEAREQEQSEPLAFAPRPSQHSLPTREPNNRTPREQGAQDNVMRDGNSVSLIGRLPWWRNDSLQPISYGSAEAKSQILAAATSWLLANPAPDIGTVVEDQESIVVADALEFNAIDQAFASVPAPPVPTFWHSLIAILGGIAAAAAVVAVSARSIFA